MLLRRSGSQALVLEEAAEHFSILGQGLDHRGLMQLLFPQLRLPQQAVEQLRLCCLHLHRTSPHPQRAAVVHLQVANKRFVRSKTSSLRSLTLRLLGTFLKASSTFSGAGCPSQPRFFSLASIRRCCVLRCSLLLLCSCSSSWSRL